MKITKSRLKEIIREEILRERKDQINYKAMPEAIIVNSGEPGAGDGWGFPLMGIFPSKKLPAGWQHWGASP